MPQGIEIKSLNDIPGFSSQQQTPGMQVPAITPPTGPIQQMDEDPMAVTPAYDPAEALQSLKGIAAAQREYFKAAETATIQNTQIQQDVYTENVKQQDNVLGAYDKLQRIGRNPLAELFALFDPSTWSKEQQLIEIEKSQLKSQQATMRGQAQININNATPAIKKTGVELAEIGFKNQQNYFTVVKGVTELTHAEQRLRIDAVDLRLKMSQEERALFDLKAKSLSTEQAKAQLKAAKSGKGEWVGREGILEDIIQRSEKQDLDAAQIRQNMQAQRFDLAEKQMASLVRGADFDDLSAGIEQAIAAGQSAINIRGIPVPLGLAITGAEAVRKDTEAFTAAAIARSSYGMQEKVDKLLTSNSAIALTNPKAAQRVQDIKRFREGLDLNDPRQARSFDAFLDVMRKDTDADAKTASSIYQSPGAKAAYEEFVNTGQMPSQGAHFLVEEAIADPSIVNKSKFAPSYEALRVEAVRRLQAQNITGAPSVNLEGGDASTEASKFLAWAFRQAPRQAKDIYAEVVQSGTGDDIITKNVTGAFRSDAMRNVVNGLATAPGSSPVFVNLLKDKTLYTTKDGRIDAQTFANYLIGQSVLTGGKVDYFQTFKDALDMYSTSADSVRADPSMTVADHALLGQKYGSNPQQTVLREFSQDLTIQAMQLEKAINIDIRNDVTGQTQRSALNQFPDLTSEPGLASQFNQQVPSATGIPGVTAEDIKRIYGTDPRFGSPPVKAPPRK